MLFIGRWESISALLLLLLLLSLLFLLLLLVMVVMMVVVVVSPLGTGPGDNRWLLYGRVGDRQFIGVKVVLVQRILAADDELHRHRHLLVDSRWNGNQWRCALLVLFVLWIAGKEFKLIKLLSEEGVLGIFEFRNGSKSII